MPMLNEIVLGENANPDRRYGLADLFRENAIKRDANIVNAQNALRTEMENNAKNNSLNYLANLTNIDAIRNLSLPKFNLGDIKVNTAIDRLNFHWGNKMNDVNLNLNTNGDKSINWSGRF